MADEPEKRINSIDRGNHVKKDELLSESELRIIELSLRGIFACPEYIDLFDNYDDIRIK